MPNYALFSRIGIDPRVDFIARQVKAGTTHCTRCQAACWIHPTMTPAVIGEAIPLCDLCGAKQTAKSLLQGNIIEAVTGLPTADMKVADDSYNRRN